VRPDRDAGRAPLTQVLFVLQNTPSMALELTGLTLDTLDVGSDTAKLDLILAMEERPHGLTGTFEYNTDLFDASTVKLMVGHFKKLLDEFTRNPDLRVLDARLSESQAEQPAGVAPRAQEKFADDQFTF
jgi:non-ribosomal peptide synthetase component F